VSKEENRGKLIRELQDLGKLIAPTDEETPEEGALDSNDPSSANLTDTLGDGIPATDEDDISGGPETVDMFVPEDTSTEKPSRPKNDRPPAKAEQDNAEVPESSISNASLAPEAPERLDSDDANPRGSGDYLDELVDELVGAVEKRLSLQSGESLPESLRDELSHDIRDRLSPWWSES